MCPPAGPPPTHTHKSAVDQTKKGTKLIHGMNFDYRGLARRGKLIMAGRIVAWPACSEDWVARRRRSRSINFLALFSSASASRVCGAPPQAGSQPLCAARLPNQQERATVARLFRKRIDWMLHFSSTKFFVCFLVSYGVRTNVHHFLLSSFLLKI